MAGDWLKFEKSTSDKPEVWAMADKLGIDPDAVVGKLLRVWAWFDEQSEDGTAPSTVMPMIDRRVGVTGFCDAMSEAGWMVKQGDTIKLPNHDTHNSATAKKRALTARRVAKHKSNAQGNAKVTEEVTERVCIPRPIRAKVFGRDKNQCVYCKRKEGSYGPGETKMDGAMSIDHVIPITENGSEDVRNLVTACLPCNRYKNNRTPEQAGLDWPLDENGERYGSVTNALPREEKRREEKSSKDTPPKSPNGDSVNYDSWPELPDEQILKDWIAARKKAKATHSQTAINNIGKELHKAKAMGFSVDDCLAEAVTRGWRGLKAEWMHNATPAQGQPPTAPRPSHRNEMPRPDRPPRRE